MDLQFLAIDDHETIYTSRRGPLTILFNISSIPNNLNEATMDHIYGLTVQGIQSYIFDTNNLREIIGASEIVEAVCTDWFTDFLILNGLNDGIHIQNAAGNIKYLTTENTAKLIYRDFGELINKKAPGLPFSQAVVKGMDLKELDKRLSAQRNQPLNYFDSGHMGRFLARTTGDMAVKMETSAVRPEVLGLYKKKRSSIDLINFTKFVISEDAKSRLCKKAGITEEYLTKDFENMAEEGKHSWLSLIHIDGNGMGNYIRELAKNKDSEGRSKAIREFADKFSSSTQSAFLHAFKKTFSDYFTDTNILRDKTKKIPFRPLILGGDDITVILRADFAIPFVQSFLTEFEKQTLKNLPRKFTASAGLALVKAKFPFHYTTSLAEELCGAAKVASERKYSSVLFHKVSDSFITNYEDLVEKELQLPNVEKSRISRDCYNLDEIKDLEKQVAELKNQKGLKNAIRQWVDLSMNNSPEAFLIEKRAIKKYGDFNKYPKKQYADYLTLLAIN